MYNLCNVPDDDSLPEVHRLLAASPKGEAYAILGSHIETRAHHSPVPLTSGCLPLSTPKLTDNVFRCFRPGGTGLAFGEGLSPFACICEGHSEATTVRQLIKRAEIAEGGTSMSLADAETLTTTDVRFPTTPQAAIEKLYAWSVVVDIFHGVAHPISKSIREFVLAVGPALHVVHQNAVTPAIGMDHVNRVLYEAQQDYFQWAGKAARSEDPAVRTCVPNFLSIQAAVSSFRTGGLSALPGPWYLLLGAPPDPARQTRPNPAQTDRPSSQQERATPTLNPNPDRALLKRFKESGFTNISTMMDGKEVTIPKHSGKDVCLVWGLKGECSAGCKRKGQHVRYAQATNRALNELLTKCGVRETQA
jgi:hypothetical protein